ncbi:GNAT family N-acetyltransferase [Lysobacter sp. K5869]|uniref:GNAT family N-acetyltransferase n=1 Tax=Lysobacter sp. K5869 TaxID=2820808 RepID=UPI001C05FA4E|nr:GNAT family N-acetyltransferase [Lysobacter sp. K5869]QWP77075.1 GNAT family N-acetyltransferase [Lysobacter sp. K5869]
MSGFSAAAEKYWRDAFAGGEVRWSAPSLTVSVDPGLRDGFRAVVLETAGGARAALTPELAAALSLDAAPDFPALRQALTDAGAALYGADNVFYFPRERHAELSAETPPAHVRALTPDDAAAFARFESQASEQDLDDAYVALDHDAAFGAFDGGRLVCAASMYAWNASPLMDLGVLTLPAHRGRGHARAVVRAIAREALRRGFEPQYRCQLDNAASVGLAAAAGLSLYGQWDFVRMPE